MAITAFSLPRASQSSREDSTKKRTFRQKRREEKRRKEKKRKGGSSRIPFVLNPWHRGMHSCARFGFRRLYNAPDGSPLTL